jgi:hypothetical protein
MWSPAAIKTTARKAIELKRATQASGSASKMGRCISHVLGRIAAPNNHPDVQSFRKMERWSRNLTRSFNFGSRLVQQLPSSGAG